MTPPDSEHASADVAAGATLDLERLTTDDLAEAWNVLDAAERMQGLMALPRHEAEDLFLTLR